MQLTSDAAWYIIYTKPLCEKRVFKHLEKMKINYYCPMNRLKRQQHHRTITIDKPLFPSHIFIQTTADSLTPLKKVKGVISVVHRMKEPAIIPSEEIKSIRNFLEQYENVLTEKMSLSTSFSLPTAQALVTQEDGVNYVAKLRLPSLGSVLTSIISLETTVKPLHVLPLPEEIPAYTTKVAN